MLPTSARPMVAMVDSCAMRKRGEQSREKSWRCVEFKPYRSVESVVLYRTVANVVVVDGWWSVGRKIHKIRSTVRFPTARRYDM